MVGSLVVLLVLCGLLHVGLATTLPQPPNATLPANETSPVQAQEVEEEDGRGVRLEVGVVQDFAAEIVLPQHVPPQSQDKEEEQLPQGRDQLEQPPQSQDKEEELQPEEQPELPPQGQEEKEQPMVLAKEEGGPDAVKKEGPEQHSAHLRDGALDKEGVVEEQALGKDMEGEEKKKEQEEEGEDEEDEEEDKDEHEAAERDSLAEIKGIIEAQAEEERRLAEDAALDEARAHAAEREAVRQEAEEKRQTRRRVGDAHAGATGWGHSAGSEQRQGSSSSSSNSSNNGSGSANRGGAFASLSGGGSGGPFGRMGGLGRASNAGASASASSSSSRRGRVPPTDEQAQAEMMSAAFGRGAGGAGTTTATFEEMMTQHESSRNAGSGAEESATVRARLAAKLVLETDALLYGGQGGLGGAGLMLEAGDEDVEEEEEGGAGEGKKAALVRDRTGKEIARILREGDKDDPNWYTVLGLSRRASPQAVKDSFRRLVLLIHPDKTASRGAQEAFQLVQEAYESLSSTSDRRAYDQYRIKLRAKRWKQRLRPLVDKLDEFSDYYEPVLERKGKIAFGAFLLWALVL